MSIDAINGNDGGLEQEVEQEIKEALSFDMTGDPITDAAILNYIRQPRYHVVLPDNTELSFSTRLSTWLTRSCSLKCAKGPTNVPLKQLVEESNNGQLDSRLAQLAYTS